jgi:fatty acid desaturase
MTARTTRIGMIILGLALWATAIAWPGFQWPVMLLGVALVMAAVFGLMVDEPGPDSNRALGD